MSRCPRGRLAGELGTQGEHAGPGDDWIKSSDDDEVDKVNGGDGFDICFFSAGDELANCEY